MIAVQEIPSKGVTITMDNIIMDGPVPIWKVCCTFLKSMIHWDLSIQSMLYSFRILGTVGDNSCYEYGACYTPYGSNYIFEVGDNSCRGQASCLYSGESKCKQPS